MICRKKELGGTGRDFKARGGKGADGESRRQGKKISAK